MAGVQYAQTVTKKSPAQFILGFIIIFILVIFLMVGLYFLYQTIPGEPIFSNPILKGPSEVQIGTSSSSVSQFYKNMKFNHNVISYSLDPDCEQGKKDRMVEAFLELSKQVSSLDFYQSSEKADIEISCDESIKEGLDESYFIAGEGGAKAIIQTGTYNVITEGIVLLHDSQENSITCDWPIVELHELLHVFGFDHSTDEDSLMYPILNSCNQKLDIGIVEDLEKLYSEENLAELYFKNVKAIKKGKYLDFDVNISNAGVVAAENLQLGVFEGDEEIKSFDLTSNGVMDYGAGISLQISNLKLSSRGAKDIKLVLDSRNWIKEYDEDNNIIDLTFD